MLGAKHRENHLVVKLTGLDEAMRSVADTARAQGDWWITRAFVRVLMLLLIGAFVFLLFFTQFIGEEGKRELFQHHAFLLPWPMLL